MELHHIEYFIAVAEELNFTRAAQRLMISQPPLSRQIQALEEELGSRLFERSPHGLRLTPAGSTFLQYAMQIHELVSRSRADVSELSGGLQGTIDIASVEGHAPRQIAGWIASFREEHPKIQYTIWNGSTDDVIYRVTRGLAEVGVITEPHNAEGLHAFPVYKEPWAALIPASDPLAADKDKPLPISQLEGKDLIIPSRQSRLHEIRSWFSGETPNLHVICRISHMLNAFELVRRGVGIAIYPVSDNHFSGDPTVVIRKLSGSLTDASYILVWDRTKPLSHIAKLFIDHIRTQVTDA